MAVANRWIRKLLLPIRTLRQLANQRQILKARTKKRIGNNLFRHYLQRLSRKDSTVQSATHFDRSPLLGTCKSGLRVEYVNKLSRPLRWWCAHSSLDRCIVRSRCAVFSLYDEAKIFPVENCPGKQKCPYPKSNSNGASQSQVNDAPSGLRGWSGGCRSSVPPR